MYIKLNLMVFIWDYAVSSMDPNIGEFETTMPLNRTQAQYQVDDCKINLKFAFDPKMGHTIRVSETNNMSCGFGHNVSADGVFLKVRLRSRYNIQYFHHSPPLPLEEGENKKA